jgi:AraC-like DNA-binding protein
MAPRIPKDAPLALGRDQAADVAADDVAVVDMAAGSGLGKLGTFAMVGIPFTPVSRRSGDNYCEKDIVDRAFKTPPLPFANRDDDNLMPVACRATDYPAGHVIEPHSHTRGQLVYAAHGVIMVAAEGGQWVVPPTRGIWMPAGSEHWIRCIGEVKMRSIYIRPDAAPQLPTRSQAVGISPLLRELILAAMNVEAPYSRTSRDGLLMRLLLDELRALPVLPLHLPQPNDPRLRRICARLSEHPVDGSTLADWADRLEVDAKTIQRLFSRETGMTFGQWRQQARLLRALEKLASGEKIIDIALSLGYESPSAFAAMFKRQFGESPSAFFAQQTVNS